MPGFRDVAIGVPGGHFRREAHDGGARVARYELDGELVEPTFIVVKRIVGASDKPLENRKFLARVGLQIFQRLFDLRARQCETFGVRNSLRVNSARESGKTEKGKNEASRTKRNGHQGNCSKRSCGSHPRWPSGVSTPSQCGVTIRMTTSVYAEMVLRLAAE